MTNHSPTDAGIGHVTEQGTLLPSFEQATWRGTTPVDETVREIGISFTRAGGEALRMRLPVESASTLASSLVGYLTAFSNRSDHSAKDRCNTRRFLQRVCRAAMEDIAESIAAKGAGSAAANEVTERYKRQLDRHFLQLLNEAVKSLDRDLG